MPQIVYYALSDFLSIVQTCEGTTSLSNSVITSPTDARGQAFNCTWTLTNGPEMRISLEFTQLEISNDVDCISNFIEILHGDDTETFCKISDAPNNFVTDDNVVTIRFHSKHFTDWRKFTIKYKSVEPGK